MRVTPLLPALALAAALLGQQHDSENLAPYLPSPQVVVDKMLEAAQVKPGEVVYDLGCGDGRVVITAAQKYRARAVGIEIQESLFKSTAKRVADMGLNSLVRIVHGNALLADLSPADVVTVYLLTSSNARLKPNFEKYLRPGARVVSYEFEIPGWTPVHTETFQAGKMDHKIYVYEIPARKGKK
ncbi:MAG: class I SAM-dependent methyltransferase [Acidobacteria bacterium]|nr:class I SAM-dependent methyltransferase [Acidobacteriota bacterium]